VPGSCDDFDNIVTDLDSDGLDVECEKDCNDNLANACQTPTTNTGSNNDDGGGTSSGGGTNGGISGGSGIDKSLNISLNVSNTTNTTSCTVSWICDNWSECTNNSQKRICINSNNCSVESIRPLEEKECEQIMINQSLQNQLEGELEPFAEESNFSNKITGAFIGRGGSTIFYLLIFFIMIGGLIAIGYNTQK
jgi:hypothetical protein